jgi:hypothetical protein
MHIRSWLEERKTEARKVVQSERQWLRDLDIMTEMVDALEFYQQAFTKRLTSSMMGEVTPFNVDRGATAQRVLMIDPKDYKGKFQKEIEDRDDKARRMARENQGTAGPGKN